MLSTQTKDEKQENITPKLTISEKVKLLRGAVDYEYFHNIVRPMLYQKCSEDPKLVREGLPESVHELILDSLHENAWATRFIAPFFKAPENVIITIKEKRWVPFGTAAGVDKNCLALEAFGNIFGFQEPGTVIIPGRKGNDKPRVAVSEKDQDIYNAQGFPSDGVEKSSKRLSDYRENGGNAKIIVSICGLPLDDSKVSEEVAVGRALDEILDLIEKLPNVQGYVWNPFSPNTASLKMLRKPSTFHRVALMLQVFEYQLKLVKMGPYEKQEKDDALALMNAFISGGGDGVVTTNTKMFPKEQLPYSIKDTWGYQSAGRSGRFLRNYRMRSVMDIRKAFPNSTIVATGGIFDANDAFETFVAGANLLEGYTPYAYYGPGLVRYLMHGVSERLSINGVTLEQLQQEVKKYALKGKDFSDYKLR